MEEILMSAKGVNGQLELLADKVRISRKGAMSLLIHGLKGDKEILISRISSIQFKEASNWFNGYIQFTFEGGREAKGGLTEATQDENSVVFRISQQDDFVKIKAAVEERMLGVESPPTHQTYLDELEKLAELRDKGIITEEEFKEKKKQILGI